jgi:hypothetical protein
VTGPLTVPLAPLQVLPLPSGGNQGNHSQGQDNGDLGGNQQGDSGQSQDNNDPNNGQGNPNDPSNPTDDQTGGQTTPGDSSTPGSADGSDSVQTPADPSGSSQDAQNQQTAEPSTPDNDSNPGSSDASVPDNAPADSSSSSQDAQNNPITDGPSTGQGNGQPNQADSNQGSNNAAVPPGNKTSNDPAAGLLPDTSTGTNSNTAASASAATSSSAGDGIGGMSNSQTSTPDRKPHTPSSGSVFDGEPHGPLVGSDGKPRGPDSTVGTGEDLHTSSTLAVPTLEQSSRYQAGIQSPAQSVTWEDPVLRQVERRVVAVEASPESGLADSLPTPADEVLALANALHQGLVRGDDLVNLPPQNHGLVTKLFVDPASLRSEVESFFSQIDDLGAQPADRALGMILSSGAVVVGAAMACEIARRQARRPTTGPVFAVPYAEAPSGIGLPNLGQFSALS